MPTKIAEPKLRHSGSHTVSESQFGVPKGIDREQVFTYWRTEWRGEPVTVTMQSDRYANSDGVLGKWRTYCYRANYFQSTGTANTIVEGDPVSERAKQLLGEACSPLAEQWLGTLDYEASESMAYCHMILTKAGELKPHDYQQGKSRELRRMVEQYRNKLPEWFPYKILELCEVYDSFVQAYDNLNARFQSR